MIDWIKANKMFLLIGVVISAALGIYYFAPLEKDISQDKSETDWLEAENIDSQEAKENESEAKTETNEQQEQILIDVKGAVAFPGVYEAKTGERVINVIDKAGGLLDSADKNNINFAMKVADEMVLYIPVIGEQGQVSTEATTGALQAVSADADDKVNLNKASETDLQTLPGIGPSKAAAIIEYREKNGSFKAIEDLMEISGIGEKTFEKLKEHITVK